MIPPYEGPEVYTDVNIEVGNSSEYQLFNLKTDQEQQKNLASEEAELLKEMIASFAKARGDEKKNVEDVELK